MIKFVNEKTGELVLTESDNGEVKFHLEEDQKKAAEQDKEEEQS